MSLVFKFFKSFLFIFKFYYIILYLQLLNSTEFYQKMHGRKDIEKIYSKKIINKTFRLNINLWSFQMSKDKNEKLIKEI